MHTFHFGLYCVSKDSDFAMKYATKERLLSPRSIAAAGSPIGPLRTNFKTTKTMNTQKVTVELARSGKFRLDGSQKTDDLNPKALMLCAAAKCAGLTLQGILRKEKITLKALEISVEGVLDTPEVQAGSRFRSFNVSYNAQCKAIADQNAVSRAIALTQDKYCGTIAMLRMIAPVAHEISVVSTERVRV